MFDRLLTFIDRIRSVDRNCILLNSPKKKNDNNKIEPFFSELLIWLPFFRSNAIKSFQFWRINYTLAAKCSQCADADDGGPDFGIERSKLRCGIFVESKTEFTLCVSLRFIWCQDRIKSVCCLKVCPKTTTTDGSSEFGSVGLFFCLKFSVWPSLNELDGFFVVFNLLPLIRRV